MDLARKFSEFLTSNKVSKATLKNYSSDLNFFLAWYYECYKEDFSPENLTETVIADFRRQNSQKLALSSLKRHLSTLRKFSGYLISEGYLTAPALEKSDQIRDPFELRKIKDFLYLQGASSRSIKNYTGDIKQFLVWADKVIQPQEKWLVRKNIYENLDNKLIDEYKRRLSELNFSPLSINRKLSSLRKLISWAYQEKKILANFLDTKPEFPFNARSSFLPLKKGGGDILKAEFIAEEPGGLNLRPLSLPGKGLSLLDSLIDFILVNTIDQGIRMVESLLRRDSQDSIFRPNVSKIPRIQPPLQISNLSKSFYDPLNVSVKSLPFPSNIIHIIKFNRPNWYLKYHNYSIVHYIHFSVLVIFMSILGFSIYQKFWGPETAVLGTSTTASSREFTIKQRLLNSSGTAITSPSDVRFAIYNDEEASGSSKLWEEVNRVNPDLDGNFTTVIGQEKQIPGNIFTSYPSVWLGLTVGQTEELRPRQQLSQVSYASNAQTLQNLGIADLDNYTNSVLALDSTGNLSIGGQSSHIFQSLNSEFILSGNTLTLSTVLGTNSNIQIAPDGLGIIDLQRPIQNSSNNNNVLSALGSVEFDDNVSILATSSGQSALTINQNDIGPLISASSGGIARFTVDSFGLTTLSGDINFSGNNPSMLSLTSGSTLSIGTTGKGELVLQPTSSGNIEFFSPLNTLSSSGTLRITGDLNLATSSATIIGGIKYTWPTGGQQNGYFLKTNGSGALSWAPIPDLTTIWNQTGGNVGFGTTAPNFRLDVQDSQTATAAAQIFNTNSGGTASGLVIKLGNTSASTDLNNKWVTFEQSGIGIVGLIKGNGSTGITFQGNGVSDFAEYLKKDPAQVIGFGEVVCLSSQGLVYPCQIDDESIVGVTSQNPTFLGGENLGDRSIPVGLTGQVLTQVSNLSGDIKPGDALTPSVIPGVAVKANREGRIVGRALSGFGSSDCPFDGSKNFGLVQTSTKTICKSKIYIILNVSHYEPSLVEKTEQLKNIVLKDTGQGLYELKDSLGEEVLRTEAFASAAIANLTAGTINAKNIVAHSLNVTESIKVAGKDLKDYIAEALGNQPEIKSPIGSFETLHANVISPIGSQKNLVVKLGEKSSFKIEDSSGSAAVSISSQGNATFSGQLQSQSLQTQNVVSENASIAGVIRAGKIIADQIEGQTREQPDYIDIASMSSQFVYVSNLRALTGNFIEGLIAQSPSSLSDVSIFGRLSIEQSFVLASNSINVLGSDLEIQSLRQGGLSLMAGLIYIDTEGNVRFAGNAEFAKNVSVKGELSANVISPLPEQNLTINIGDNNGSGLSVKNSTNSSILSLNQRGDLSASGSGSFNKLNLTLVKPAFAISPTESVATGSAGIATVSAYRKELTIYNSLVTEDSLIYVTPRIDTSNVVIYLLRQIPNISFTIGINSVLPRDIPFNWIIIN